MAIFDRIATDTESLAPAELSPRAKRQRIGALLAAYGAVEAVLLGYLFLIGLQAADGTEPLLVPFLLKHLALRRPGSQAEAIDIQRWERLLVRAPLRAFGGGGERQCGDVRERTVAPGLLGKENSLEMIGGQVLVVLSHLR